MRNSLGDINQLGCRLLFSISICCYSRKTRRRITTSPKNSIGFGRATQQQRSFFAYLSHEIRNPLTSILGTTEAILTELPNGLLKQQMRRLQKSTFHVNQLLEQVLDFSSLQSEQITLNMEQIDVIEMIEMMIELHKDICSQKQIQMHLVQSITHKEPQERIFIQADYVRLHQVLLNIISNAIKFSTVESSHIYLHVDVFSGDIDDTQEYLGNPVSEQQKHRCCTNYLS